MKPIGREVIKKIFTKRPLWAHKGNYGRLLVIGGSRIYSGSPALAALAAIKTGVDLVTVVAPERAANIIASFSPDIITYPLHGDFIEPRHIPEINLLAKNSDVVVIGGGLTRNRRTLDFVLQFLEKIKVPCVVDADAIHAFQGNLSQLRPNYTLTPHSYEFSVLSGTLPKPEAKSRAELVKRFAAKTKTVVLLKGHVDVISDGINTAINTTGNPFMTKGGTGDTLAGICGSLLAQQIEPFDSACAAAYINGFAGDLAAKEYGPSLFASDLVNYIHKVLR